MAIYPTPDGNPLSNPFSTVGMLGGPVGAVAGQLGGQLLSSLLPNPAMRLAQQGQAFQQNMAVNSLQRQNANRAAVLPGMYETLGYSPTEAKAKATTYANIPVPGATTGTTGKAKDVANSWVKGTQNPFDANMSSIDKQVQAGAMTGEDAAAKKTQLVTSYLTQLGSLAKQGGHAPTVAQQAVETFRKYYGDPRQYGVDTTQLGLAI